MSKTIKIGTRDSELALWQAKTVAAQLTQLGYNVQLIPVKSTGDLILDKPLYELGITGVFTKTLDVAMLKGEIDIAVHSLKDVPTVLPQGIVQGAVLQRANPTDLLVYKHSLDFLTDASTAVIATGSLRRKAQWLHRFPHHQTVDIRGNVNSRLQKLQDNSWQATIFALAGLERIDKKPENSLLLDWMIPAPAQGIVMCAVMESDVYCREALSKINHSNVEICAFVERQFLKTLEGGCTAPIGALAVMNNQTIHFKGVLFSLDGKQKIEIDKNFPLQEWKEIGHSSAQEILAKGGIELMKSIKETLKK